MLFTFPSRYWFTIGLSGVFSLAGWSRRIRSGLHVSRLTQESAMIHKLACTGLSPSVITFSKVFHFIYFINVAVLLPRYCRNNNGLGLSPVARRYWGNHVCFLLLQVLRCFSSLRSLRNTMYSCYDTDCSVGFPIRTFTDQCLFTTPRDFSQCITSFFASECQGIHQMPLPIA